MSEADDEMGRLPTASEGALSDIVELSQEELLDLLEHDEQRGLRSRYLRLLLRSRIAADLFYYNSNHDDVEVLTNQQEDYDQEGHDVQTSVGILASTEVDQQMIDSGVECAICLSPPAHGSSVTTLRCGHLFDVTCIFRWLAESNSCPLCRQDVFQLGSASPGSDSGESYGSSSVRGHEQQAERDRTNQERHVHWAS